MELHLFLTCFLQKGRIAMGNMLAAANVEAMQQVNSFFAAGGGQNTITKIKRWGEIGLSIVLIACGSWLLIKAIMGFTSAIHGNNKDWGGAMIAVLVGIIGGLFLTAGATWAISLFQNMGNDLEI